MGLAIVYQIVQAHEGKVWARSKPGQGTTFVLRLHRAADGEVLKVKNGDEAVVLSAAVAAGQGGAHA